MANQWRVMSEYCLEQHPLLCEEESEEKEYSPRYYRRVRPMTYRGRARNNLKGAAAILTRWPDHWSSFLTYWWIGIGMISLTTFVIYNSLFAFSMIPSVSMEPSDPIITNENKKFLPKTVLLPDIYMHIFVGQNEEIDINQYMPYIEMISNKFLDFQFNFIIMINDTNMGWMSAEENNELALNMLWTKDKNIFVKETPSPNVNIQRVSLSAYMNNSPLRKYWRTLPHQLIEFLARTVSIWDKGGVAFNPDILTPRFQHTLYIEKLQILLNKYAHTTKAMTDPKLMNKPNKPPKKHRKLDNIRDIIVALENEDMSANAYSQQTLSEAENKDIEFISHKRQISTVTESLAKNTTVVSPELANKEYTEKRNVDSTKLSENNISLVYSTESSEINSNNTKMSLLPLFLEFLFHKKPDIKPKPAEETVSNRTRKSVIVLPNIEKNDSSTKEVSKQIVKNSINNKEPVIVSAAGLINKSRLGNSFSVSSNMEKDENLERNRLTIDLKGNIIATDTACHAFLGTIFSNVIHHSEEETITDFIIAELTIFCKGLLSSCMGIDLILL